MVNGLPAICIIVDGLPAIYIMSNGLPAIYVMVNGLLAIYVMVNGLPAVIYSFGCFCTAVADRGESSGKARYSLCVI